MPTEHPILEAMRRVVLPRVERGCGRIMPSEEDAVEPSGRHAPIFPFEMHAHETFEWVWLIDGYTHIRVGNAVRRLDAGDFCLLSPRTAHVEMFTRGTPQYRSLWFTYRDTAISALLFEYRPVNYGHCIARCAAPAPPRIAMLLACLQDELESDTMHAPAIRRGLLMTLAHVSMRALEAAPLDSSSAPQPGLTAHRVLSYLRRHYSEEITLDDVARATGRSRAYLAATFKRETGQTVWEVLTAIRLEHAKALLLERQLPIHAIARAVGYANPEHFSRVFLRHERIPPSRYGK
jgi:AraC-like DNA-binding protein